jgi:hypothetical protein
MSTQARIDRWLGEVLATVGDGDGVQIVLVHAAVDQTQRTVKSWKLAEAVDDIAALVTDIEESAQDDAEGLGGRQRYVLRGQLKGREVGSLTLRYEHRPDDMGGPGPAVDSEPPTAAGTIAVLQRHAEGAMRLMVQSFSGVIESYKEQVNAQKALIMEFQKQATENFRLQEELASKKVEQTILLQERRTQLELTAAKEISELRFAEDAKKKGLEALLRYAPLLMNFATNGQVGPSVAEVVGEARAAQNGRGQPGPSLREEPSLEDQSVAVGAVRLYETLCAQRARLHALVGAFLARAAFADLAESDRAVLAELADAVSQNGPAVEPEGLWAALGSKQAQLLLPLVQCISVGAPWTEVDVDRKVLLMALVRQAAEDDVSGFRRQGGA